MSLRQLALLLVLFAAVAFAFATPRQTAEFKIVGRITNKTVAALRNAQSSVEKVVVTSQGGDTRSAIALARLVRERGYPVVVRRYCLSACAQWLLPAAYSVTLEEMPIVGMHHTATAFKKLLLKAGEEGEAQKYASLAQLEQSFYAEIGVDFSLLIYPYLQTNVLCFWPSSGEYDDFAMFASEWGFVSLSSSSYERLTGRSAMGRWAESKEELSRYSAQHIPAKASLSIVPEDVRHSPNQLHIPKLSRCPTETPVNMART